MINVRSQTAKRRLQAAIDRRMRAIESKVFKQLQSELNKQYSGAAAAIANGKNPAGAVNNRKAKLKKILEDNYKRTALIFGRDIFDQLPKGKSVLTDYNKWVTRWAVRLAAMKVVDINLTTKKRIAAAIVAGRADGLSSVAIASRIRKQIAPIDSAYRAQRIARTETHTASVGGMNAAMEQTKLTYTREWGAANDARTRDDHAAADGQIADKDGYYTVGGEKLKFPGDPEGSPGNIINCRCVEFYNTEAE